MKMKPARKWKSGKEDEKEGGEMCAKDKEAIAEKECRTVTERYKGENG